MFVERKQQNASTVYSIGKDENNITKRVIICKAKDLLKALQY